MQLLQRPADDNAAPGRDARQVLYGRAVPSIGREGE